jgi:hypothetical protein
LIKQIITELKVPLNSANRLTPALSTKILEWDEKAPNFNQCFHYWCVIGQLNFLKKSTQCDIAYATHQVARFCQDPRKAMHAEAIKHIARYLHNTSNEGITLHRQTKISHLMFSPMQQTLLETGTEWLHLMTWVLPSHDLAMLSSMPVALLHDVLSCKPSMHSLPVKLNMWHFLSHYEIPSLSWTLSMSSRITDFQSWVLNQECSARLSKITQVLSIWHVSWRWDPVLSTSTSSIITSESMSALNLLRYFLFLPQNSLLIAIAIHQATRAEHLSQAQEGSAALAISEFTYFINFYWMRECDNTVNLYIL